MRKFLLLFLINFITISLFSQTIVYHENFELTSLADSVVSSGNTNWGISTKLSNNGLRSDTASISAIGDTAILSTISFSTSGYLFVTLNFAHICKIEFFDAAIIEVSNDSGLTWTQLTGNHYQGNGQFVTIGSKFSSTSYSDWLPAQNTAIPTNLWWKNETFNISAIAGNSANVMVRFKMTDVNSSGGAGTYGWLIDDIEVIAAIDELNPPLISLFQPIPSGTIFSLGPFDVNAEIIDTSGIDTAYIVYTVNFGSADTVGMTEIAPDTFKGFIPVVQDLDSVCYYVVAIDSSLISNLSSSPANGCISFTASSGIHLPYFDNFDGVDTLWYSITTDTATQWELGIPTYGLLNSAYSSPRVWGINLDTSYNELDTAYLYSPFFDFSSALDMKLSFWQNRNTEFQWDGCHFEYSTNGLTWGKLGTLNDPNGVNWYNDTTYSASGQGQWTGNSSGWIKSEYPLDIFNNNPMVQFRFVFISDPYVSYEGIIIDDISIIPKSSNDAGVISILEPNSGCGLSSDSVKIMIRNFGSDTINGGLTANYKLYGSSQIITDTITSQILSGDTIYHTFSIPVNLTVSSYDSTFIIIAYTKLIGDTTYLNDTLTKSVTSGIVPPNPVISDVTIPYASSTTLTAISSDSIYWYNVPWGENNIHLGANFTTGILYDSATYYLEARTGVPDIKLTEVTLNSSGIGCSNPYPPFITSLWDGIEITNLGNSQANVSNYSVHMEIVGNYLNFTIPQGVNLDPGQTLLLTYYSNPVLLDDTANNFYIVSTNTYINTTSLHGYYIKDPNGNIVDAVAFNSYVFSTASGITSTDWSGSISGTSTKSGYIRIVSDNNIASDWVVSDAPSPIQTIGSLNPMLSLPPGIGCSSNRVAVNVNLSDIPNFDAGVLSVDSPITAINLTNAEEIFIKIKNYGKDTISNFPVSYVINNNPVVTDTVFTSILPGDTFNFAFTTTADLSGHYIYQIKTYPTLAGDSIEINDTAYATVINQLPAYCASGANYNYNTVIDEVIFNTISNNTASQCAMYSDFTTISTSVYKSLTYPLSITLGTCGSNYTKGAKVFIDWNCDGDLTDPGEEIATIGTTSLTTSYTIYVTIPNNASTGITKMRIVCEQTSNISSITPCGSYYYGETEDYTIDIIPPFSQDAGITDIIEPIFPLFVDKSVQVKARIHNYGSDTLTSIPLVYTINGANPVIETFTGNLYPGDDVDYSFNQYLTVPLDTFDLCVYTALANDGYNQNDTSCTTYVGEPQYTILYFNDFDGKKFNQFYYTYPSRWENGIPKASVINYPHSSPNVWAINLDGNYLNNQDDDLFSPFLNFSSVSGIKLRFYHWFETEFGNDGCSMQYTINGGATWINLGYYTDPKGTNWYNSQANGLNSWTGQNGEWMYSSYDLSDLNNYPTDVQFKFNFRTNYSISNFNGWAIDDFAITVDKIAKDAGIVQIVNPDSINAGSTVEVKVKIQNFGSDTLTSIPVNYNVNFGIPISETWTGVLLPNDTVDYTFNATFISPLNYHLCCWTTLVNDSYNFNDSTCDYLSIYGLDDKKLVHFSLEQNIPNPTSGKTYINFEIPNSGNIDFKLMNVLGQIVYSQQKSFGKGKQQIELNVSSIPAGLYYYSVEFDKRKLSRKMIIY